MKMTFIGHIDSIFLDIVICYFCAESPLHGNSVPKIKPLNFKNFA
jgi:hypothetical protein